MPTPPAPRRGHPRRHRGNAGIPKQSPRSWRFDHRGYLQGSLASRIVLQGAQTKPEDQNVCRHVGQRRENPDLDSTDFHTAATLPANVLPFRLEPGQPGGTAAHESIYPSQFDGVAGQTVYHASRSTGQHSGHLGLRLILDSTWRHDYEK